MLEISIPRIKRYALVLAVTGTVATMILRGVSKGRLRRRSRAAFLSLNPGPGWPRASIRSRKTSPPATGSGIFLVRPLRPHRRGHVWCS